MKKVYFGIAIIAIVIDQITKWGQYTSGHARAKPGYAIF